MALNKDDFEDFMNQARIKLPGSSDTGIMGALYEVLKEFFQDSLSWRSHVLFNVTAGTQSYLITPRDNGQVIKLFGVWDGNRTPVAAFMHEFGEIQVRWPVQVTTTGNLDDNTSPATLGPNNPWLVAFAENVQRPVDRNMVPLCPHWVLKVYSGCILDGVVGWLMSEVNKSYTNDTKAAYHLRRFRSAIASARTAAARQNTVGAQTWGYPRGFDTKSQRGGVSTMWPSERVF